MKNRHYLPLIDYAMQRGCRVAQGSKHLKVLSPRGALLLVLSVNGSKEPSNISYQLRRIDRQLAAEATP